MEFIGWFTILLTYDTLYVVAVHVKVRQLLDRIDFRFGILRLYLLRYILLDKR